MYVIIELQTAADGTVGSVVTTANSMNEADQQYHSKLSFAAMSEVYCHSVSMIASDGTPIKHETYWHVPVDPQPEE